MSSVNWLTKLDDVYATVRTQAGAYWEIAFAIGVVMSAFALFAIAKDPTRAAEMRRKSRQLRYCHNCGYNDSFTETCAISADVEEKCGLIDETAGLNFSIPVKE